MAHAEDQANEYEALASIYADDFASKVAPGEGAPVALTIKIVPNQGDSGPNHVGILLHVTFSEDYPDVPPQLAIPQADSFGLNEKQIPELVKLAAATAEENVGSASIYTVAERLREWLQENNEPMGTGSAYEEMIKRQRREEKEAAAAAAAPLHAYSKDADPSLAALRARRGAAASASAEDEAARKKRDGTPVTKESFFAWRDRFEKEMAAAAAAALAAATAGGKSGGAGTGGGGGAAAGAAASSAAFTGLPFLPSGPILDEKGKPKLTGKQLFESDATLATSDAALLTESDAEAAAAGSSAAAAGGAAAGGDGSGAGEFVVDASLYLDGADLDDLDGLDDDDEEEEEDEDDEEWSGDDDDEDDDDDEEGGWIDDDEDDAPAAAAAKGGAATAKAGGAAAAPAAATAGGKPAAASAPAPAAAAGKGGAAAGGSKGGKGGKR